MNPLFASSLLDELETTDIHLLLAIVFLSILACIQNYVALTRSSPRVPLKHLPPRPALQILFKPDDDLPVDDGAFGVAAAASAVVSTFVEDGDGISVFSEDTSWAEASKNRKTFDSQSATSASRARTSYSSSTRKTRRETKTSTATHHGLPDSFAPLLSSSEMQLLTHNLTADLIHACYVHATVKLQEGRHSIPLNKNELRPQFWLESTQRDNEDKACEISASVVVGSQNLTQDQDLDTSTPTPKRSRPMVKNVELVFDPPLKLGNVAPTLLHFPTLFEDLMWIPILRGSIFGHVLDFMSSLWYLVEKVLWWIERRLQVHLGKVKAVPIYRQGGGEDAHWRLGLAFSGYVLLFDRIPIPFLSVRLPTFIIPQPHALLEKLLTAQPLASARLKRENIAEEKIVIAVLNSLQSWSTNVKVVGTPPALGVDLTMPGGLTVAVEMMHGRENTNNQYGKRQSAGASGNNAIPREISNDTLSTWQTPYPNSNDVGVRSRASLSGRTSPHHHLDSFRSRAAVGLGSVTQIPGKMFDANSLVPWYFEASANGSIGKDKLVVNIPVCKARHVDDDRLIPSKSILTLTGSVVICRAQSAATVSDRRPVPARPMHKRTLSSNSHLAALNAQTDAPPIHALMLFPESYVPSTKRSSNHLLEYDYEFDVGEESHLDAISLSYGASHPMLKGGTIISCMLESIYAYGSIFAREGAIADPSEKLRKRNILRHLPAVEFTAGVENFYLPKQSVSYFDDGNTKSIPEIDGGRVMFRVTGGIDEKMNGESSPAREIDPIVRDGIKFIANFGASTFASTGETNVTEFPELDVFEGSKLCSFVLGTFDGSVTCHLRPQSNSNSTSTTGPNVFNPLEAYEIDFSGSTVSLRLKEASFNLGHRRVIVPTESAFAVKVLQSVVNMSFEGTTQCELSWDFQGSSPVLQVTSPGQTLAQSTHENRQQAPLLINDLCQGRLNLDVSSVGGISFTRASTSREDKQGLYDWKFFNALVSPDEDSPTRIRDVLYDKKTMHQLLAVMKLLNSDLEKILRYVLTQIWRAKTIFDEEGISDPGHALPSYRLARLASLFLCGDVSEVDNILPIIRRIVAADGLDIVGVKELLRKHVDAYDEWAAEIDRGVKWAAAALGPMPTAQPFVETDAPPLCETIPDHVYQGVPTAKMLYDVLQDKPNLPLDINTSKLVGRIAPYLTFRQISYVLHSRPSNHWQPFDLKRLRYVYTIKKKVQEVAESYGGLSFMPQSFFLSVFLGEATRSSLRAPVEGNAGSTEEHNTNLSMIDKRTVLSKLRRRRMEESSFRPSEDDNELFIMSPAGRIASITNFSGLQQAVSMGPANNQSSVIDDLLGDSLLGPQDVAVLLQAGLTSAMKGSTVVQLNQRMLLDLMASQPRSFATAVLAELGIGNSRALTSALMSFVEMDQSSFKIAHRIDMHHLLESWLPGIKIPKREDYLAGGRWARQSYYDAMFHVAVSILDLAETYIGLKLRLQRVRHQSEKDPVPRPKQFATTVNEDFQDKPTSKLMTSINIAQEAIAKADALGRKALENLLRTGKSTKECSVCIEATAAYKAAFAACSRVRSIDKLAFQADWFKEFYRRNYDALMVNSIYENIIKDVDRVRIWMEALRCGSKGIHIVPESTDATFDDFDSAMSRILSPVPMNGPTSPRTAKSDMAFFTAPERQKEQDLVEAIIDAIFYDSAEREFIRNDPLVRMLIPNEPGHYNFTLITAMGVITEGKKGMELQNAIERLEKERGIVTIRSDTGTARSFDYNASKIEEAAELAVQLNRPFGIVGYSQGCANEIHFESMMLSGTPQQQKLITSPDCGMVCRQLLFSAANGSIHGPAGEAKVHKLITMSEDFFKYQQGYFSRAFISSTLEVVNGLLDSSGFHKFMGGMQGFFPEYLRAFWREAQHLPHIPTCVLRGVLEPHTTPESLDMLSNQLSKQSGSVLHDSQVHVYDAVGHPIYVRNRNMRILKATDMGGAIQRTHHWSPLCEEVEYVKTNRDVLQASFDCAKDRHIFPFVDVNARFGIIKYVGAKDDMNIAKNEAVPFGVPTLSTPLPSKPKTFNG